MELFKNIRTKTLVFSNEYLNNIMKIVQSIEDASLLIKDIRETVENEVKEQKGGFLGMLDATLGASLLSSILAGNGIIRAGEGAKQQVKDKVQLELLKEQSEQIRIFNAASSFN